MPKRLPTKEALEERNLRLAPAAQDVLEGILYDAHGEVPCPECKRPVEPQCPDGHPLKVRDFKPVHANTAKMILEMAGVGPIHRVKDETPPTSPKLLYAATAAAILAMPYEEQKSLARAIWGDGIKFLNPAPEVVDGEVVDEA